MDNKYLFIINTVGNIDVLNNENKNNSLSLRIKLNSYLFFVISYDSVNGKQKIKREP